MSSEIARNPSVLVVEDDEQIRAFVCTLLVNDGLQVIQAATGPEGWRQAQEHDGVIDLLLCDMLLPEMSGYDLAAQMREQRPDLKIILMTGYVEGEIVQRGLEELNAAFLDKPFQAATLRAAVKEALRPLAFQPAGRVA